MGKAVITEATPVFAPAAELTSERLSPPVTATPPDRAAPTLAAPTKQLPVGLDALAASARQRLGHGNTAGKANQIDGQCQRKEIARYLR